MAEHLAERDLEQLLAHSLPVQRARSAGAHVQDCALCAERFDTLRRNAAAAHGLRVAMEAAGEHLDFEDELVPYAEGNLAGAVRERTERHLQHCTTCADEVADLRALIAARTPAPAPLAAHRRWRPVALAAAAACVIVVAGLWWRNTAAPDPVTIPQTSVPALRDGAYVLTGPSSGYGRADWDALAGRALSTGHVEWTRRDDLQEDGDGLRGETSPAGRVSLQPSGAVVDDPRPRFRWSGVPAGPHRVSVHLLGGGAVMTSPPLHATEWIPPRELARGQTYVWQVTVLAAGKEEVFPRPSEPQARFAVLDRETSEVIDAARRRGSHLIPALLYARAGASAEARREMTRFAAENPGSPRAAALRRQLDASN